MRYNLRNPYARYIALAWKDLEEGDFGWRPKYGCECGWYSDREPELECTYFASRAFNNYRYDPDEYGWRCPRCGNHEVFETDQDPHRFKLINRYTKETK